MQNNNTGFLVNEITALERLFLSLSQEGCTRQLPNRRQRDQDSGQHVDKMPVDFLEENYVRLFMLPDYAGVKSVRRKFDPLPLQGREIFVDEGCFPNEQKK